MSDSDLSTTSESGIAFEQVDCSGIKVETELDIVPENMNYELQATRDINFKNEALQLGSGKECAIEKLLQKPFSSLPYEEKLYYIESGRPTEPLIGLFKASKGRRSFTRHFNIKSYETVPWLTGCCRLGKLFCWPCLLFCPGKHVWNSTGYEDLNHFHAAVKRHRKSSHHITSFKELKQFIKMKTDFCLSDQFQTSVPAHNNEVKKNRKVLGHMVKAACFLAREGLFRGSGKSINEEHYIELLNELSEYDNDLKNLLINSTHFPDFFNETLETLIASVCEFTINKIKKRIDESPCVALIFDDIPDLNKTLLSTSMRYMTKDGNVRETFLGFKEMHEKMKTKSLTVHMFDCLRKFNCERKLIAYSLDGGVLTPSEYEDLEIHVKSVIPTARFENYYAHALDIVVAQSLCFIKECKIFFSNLASVEAFFIKSKSALTTELNEKLPMHSLECQYASKLVETLYVHQDDIASFLTSVIGNGEKLGPEIVCAARGLRSILEDFDFNFLLEIFSKIFTEVNGADFFFHKNFSDFSTFENKIEDLKISIKRVEDDFDLVWDKCMRVKNDLSEEPPRKKIRADTVPTENCKPEYKKLLNEIVDSSVTNVLYRLKKLPGLKFMNLLDNKFEKFKTKFPISEFNLLKTNYEKYFDLEALKGELTVIGVDKELHKENVVQLINYLVSADLVEIFPEVLKLAAVITTIPTFTSSGEIPVSNRVKNYVRETRGEDRLPGLAMLSIEKALVSELRNSPTFTEDVIDIFAQKNLNISILYRKAKLSEFLWRLRQPDGSFEMHEGGEVDMRGIYCAVSIARLTNIYTDELFQNSAEWIASCQTYEGGFAACPEMEAHGGYAFCGLAALVLLNKQRLLNIKSFLRWVVNRQMKFEGGFQGRTNKLVDGCYSFWQGGVFPIIHGILSQDEEENFLDHDRWMFHQEALQEYILICCQNSSGGFIDKPKKPRDFYHTCYTLSGLSVAQHSGKKCIVLGCKTNELSPIHPLYNIELETVSAALQFFKKQPVPIVKKSNIKV